MVCITIILAISTIEEKAINVGEVLSGKLVKLMEEDLELMDRQLRDYEMMVEAVNQYKGDGSVLNDIISDLSAPSEELSATINQITQSMDEISSTVEDSALATNNIAEMNMNMVKSISNINNVISKNEEISVRLQELVSKVKY